MFNSYRPGNVRGFARRGEASLRLWAEPGEPSRERAGPGKADMAPKVLRALLLSTPQAGSGTSGREPACKRRLCSRPRPFAHAYPGASLGGARPSWAPAAPGRSGLALLAVSGLPVGLGGWRLGGLQHFLGHGAHGHPAIHGALLDPAERLGLADPPLGLDQALGAVQQLAHLEPLLEVRDLGFERRELLEPAHRDLD